MFTTINLYVNVPFDPDYKHVGDFFTYTPAYSYTGSVQRINSQVSDYRKIETIRVPVRADNIITANYLTFTFGNKTFYCFINNINYVNENNTEITYTIDDWQTWYRSNGNSIKNCFILRNKLTNTWPNVNTIPENITYTSQITSYARYTPYNLFSSSTYYIELVTVYENAYNIFLTNGFLPCMGEFGNPWGYYVYGEYDKINWDEISRQLALEFKDISDVITDIILTECKPLTDSTRVTKNIQTQIEVNPIELNGVENYQKKLATGQFRKIHLKSSTGNSITLYPEDFTNFITGTANNVILYALAGSGMLNEITAYIETNNDGFQSSKAVTVPASITLPVFVNSSIKYTNDNIVSLLQSMTSAGVYAAAAGPVGGGVGIISGISSIADFAVGYMQQVPKLNNYTSNSRQAFSQNLYFVEIYVEEPIPEDCYRIDSYFKAYGYAIQESGIPKMSGNDFEYVQAEDITYTQSIPAYAKKTLDNMFNNGVHIFHDSNSYGIINVIQ